MTPYLSKLRNKDGKKEKERMKEMKTYDFHENYFYQPDKSIRNLYNLGVGGDSDTCLSK
jgi:hypothetical protein